MECISELNCALFIIGSTFVGSLVMFVAGYVRGWAASNKRWNRDWRNGRLHGEYPGDW
jgi:hypothetical protein